MTNARNVHCSQHHRQIGVCPACQRARLAAERQQLAECTPRAPAGPLSPSTGPLASAVGPVLGGGVSVGPRA